MNPIRSVDLVIPVYNEEAGLLDLFARLRMDMATLERPWRVICVDDGSRDRSWQILAQTVAKDERFLAVRLARNYGQHAAVLAGMERAQADAVVTLDADLQNPPSEIAKLLSKLEEGFDVAGGWRSDRQDSFLRRRCSGLMNRLISRVTGISLKDYGCMLRAYRIGVVHRMSEGGEISSFVPALAHCYTDRIAELPVAHEERKAGKSRYSLFRLVLLFMDLLTGYSMWPLRVLSFVGGILALGGIAFGFVLFALRLLLGRDWAVQGVFTLFAVLFFLVGAQFLALGLLGEYIGRIYNEVRNRPRAVVREVAGAGVPEAVPQGGRP